MESTDGDGEAGGDQLKDSDADKQARETRRVTAMEGGRSLKEKPSALPKIKGKAIIPKIKGAIPKVKRNAPMPKIKVKGKQNVNVEKISDTSLRDTRYDQNYLHRESSQDSNVDNSASNETNCANSRVDCSSDIEANSDIDKSRCEPIDQPAFVNTSLSPGFRENNENGEVNNTEEFARTISDSSGFEDRSVELSSNIGIESAESQSEIVEGNNDTNQQTTDLFDQLRDGNIDTNQQTTDAFDQLRESNIDTTQQTTDVFDQLREGNIDTTQQTTEVFDQLREDGVTGEEESSVALDIVEERTDLIEHSTEGWHTEDGIPGEEDGSVPFDDAQMSTDVIEQSAEDGLMEDEDIPVSVDPAQLTEDDPPESHPMESSSPVTGQLGNESNSLETGYPATSIGSDNNPPVAPGFGDAFKGWTETNTSIITPTLIKPVSVTSKPLTSESAIKMDRLDDGNSDKEMPRDGGSDAGDEEDDKEEKSKGKKRKHSGESSAPKPKIKRKGVKVEQEKKKKRETSSDDSDSDGEVERRKFGVRPKIKNLRRNIHDVMDNTKLDEETLAAQREEQLRLQRLHEKRIALREYLEKQEVEKIVQEVNNLAEGGELHVGASISIGKAVTRHHDDIIALSSDEEAKKFKHRHLEHEMEMKEDSDEEYDDMAMKEEVKDESSDGEKVALKGRGEGEDEGKEAPDEEAADPEEKGSDSDVMILSEHSSDDEIEDASASGAHINDEFNVQDAQGRVLVNVGHPENEEDIFLAPQLSPLVKPHQIGGIRFLYDNIVESVDQYKTSNGFGCILAHSMGLGKTLQVISFVDVFLRATTAKTALIIVPINTIQNWLGEFNAWLPESGAAPSHTAEGLEIRPRNFKVYILNDTCKNLQQRCKVIREWYEQGGALLMGYELYRQLALKKPKKPKKKKKEIGGEIVDVEEEDKDKEVLEEAQKALVRPGPDIVICDEGHRIKNAHANISQALKMIRTRRRVVLTGYPLQNNLIEYWCMVDFIRPNYLGNKTEFCNMFERPIQNGQCVDSTPSDGKLMRYRSHVLHSLLEGFVQRRGQIVLSKTLPNKDEHIIMCRMTSIQRKIYSKFMDELAATKSMANPLKAFAICCKIWNHPDILYNYVQKKLMVDIDLDIEENDAKLKGKKYAQMAANASLLNVPNFNNWGNHPGGPGRQGSNSHSGGHFGMGPGSMGSSGSNSGPLGGPMGIPGGGMGPGGSSNLATGNQMGGAMGHQHHMGMGGMGTQGSMGPTPHNHMSAAASQIGGMSSQNPMTGLQNLMTHQDPMTGMMTGGHQSMGGTHRVDTGQSGMAAPYGMEGSYGNVHSQYGNQAGIQQQPSGYQWFNQGYAATHDPYHNPAVPTYGNTHFDANSQYTQQQQQQQQQQQSQQQHSSGVNQAMPNYPPFSQSQSMHNSMGLNLSNSSSSMGMNLISSSSSMGLNHSSTSPAMGLNLSTSSSPMGLNLSNSSNMGLNSPSPMGLNLSNSTAMGMNASSSMGLQHQDQQQQQQYQQQLDQQQLQHQQQLKMQQQQQLQQQQDHSHLQDHQQQQILQHQQDQQQHQISQQHPQLDNQQQQIKQELIQEQQQQQQQLPQLDNQQQELKDEQTQGQQQPQEQQQQQHPQEVVKEEQDGQQQSEQQEQQHPHVQEQVQQQSQEQEQEAEMKAEMGDEEHQQMPSTDSQEQLLSGSMQQSPVAASDSMGQQSMNQQQQSPFPSVGSGGGVQQNSNRQSPYSNRQSPYSNQQSPYPPSVGGQSGGPHSVPSPAAPSTPQPKEKVKENIEEKEVEDKKEFDTYLKKELDTKEIVKKEEVKNEKPEDEKDERSKEISLDWTEGLFTDYVPGLLENSAKFTIFFKILEQTLTALDRLLVFSQSLFTLTLLEEFLQRSYIPGTYEGWLRNRSYFRLDGSTSAQDREKLINEFNLNPSIRIFLVSTRAGSLGINLVGANRVVVFDASFNPCHDTQAVCRVYRYGQKKECHIYRLVTDNSLEKRIYDRQINKEGMASRIVDEMNPDAHLSSKEISNLLVEGEEDPEPDETISEKADKYDDSVLKEIVKNMPTLMTKAPFKHESQLIDRKEKKLSKAEKRLAKRSYEMEKQANISYSRPSYAAFYPKGGAGQQVMMGTKIGGVVYAKPVGTVRPMQAMIQRPNILSKGTPQFPVDALAKQGVSVQQITVPKDVSIPTNSGDGKPILLKSGQSVMVIKTQKGIYLRLADGKIVAIRVPPEEAFGLPLNKGSVTIVPTMVNSPRPRGGGRGGAGRGGGGRRGRPPMAMQYAAGNISTKGIQLKGGQMAVRIIKKGTRGGRYQTIAVPVSGRAQQQAVLNKSVVITPANKGIDTTKLQMRGVKISPKVTVTHSRGGMPFRGNMKGGTVQILRKGMGVSVTNLGNQKSISVNRKESIPVNTSSEKSEAKDSVKERSDETEKAFPGETEQASVDEKEASEEKSGNDETEDALFDPVERESISAMSACTSEQKFDALFGSKESLDESVGNSENTEVPTEEVFQPEQDSEQTSEHQLEETSETVAPEEFSTENSNHSAGISTEEIAPLALATQQQNSPLALTTHRSPHAIKSPSSITNQSPIYRTNSFDEAASSSSKSRDIAFGMHEPIKPLSDQRSTGEILTGVVKPTIQESPSKSTAPLTPLQSISNLVPRADTPSTPHSETSSLSNLPHFPSQQNFSQQPLFQPFLQSGSQHSQESQQSQASNSSNNSTVVSNVAQVSPQVQQPPTPTPLPPFSPSGSSQFNNSPSYGAGGSSGSIQSGMAQSPSFLAPVSETSPQLAQQQLSTQQGASSTSSLASSLMQHAGTAGLLSGSPRSTGAIAGADSPLNLSHLLPSFDSSGVSGVPEDLSSPHNHASALDYLNYTLAAGNTSAFRRPDYAPTISPDLSSLINTAATTQQSLGSSLPSPAHSGTTSVTSASSFPSYQPPGYPQYPAAGFRAGSSVSPSAAAASAYAAYAGQYPAYSSQYPAGLAAAGLAASAAATSTSQTAAAAAAAALGPYGALHPTANPYQAYSSTSPTGRPSPYSSGLSGFGHGPYPPM